MSFEFENGSLSALLAVLANGFELVLVAEAPPLLVGLNTPLGSLFSLVGCCDLTTRFHLPL